MLFRISGGTSPRTMTSETAKPAAGLEHAKRLAEHASLVAGEIDHAVRDDDVHRRVRQRDVLDLALQERRRSSSPLWRLFSSATASMSSVISRPYALPVGRPGAPTAARRCRRPTRDRARFPRLQLGEGRRVPAAERRLHRQLGHLPRLRPVVKVRADRIATTRRRRRRGPARTLPAGLGAPRGFAVFLSNHILHIGSLMDTSPISR
jgi:hypothetical protein